MQETLNRPQIRIGIAGGGSLQLTRSSASLTHPLGFHAAEKVYARGTHPRQVAADVIKVTLHRRLDRLFPIRFAIRHATALPLVANPPSYPPWSVSQPPRQLTVLLTARSTTSLPTALPTHRTPSRPVNRPAHQISWDGGPSWGSVRDAG
jgi:hypothetical protein